MSILTKLAQVLGLSSSPQKAPPVPTETEEQRGIRFARERQSQIAEDLSKRQGQHLQHEFTRDKAIRAMQTGEKLITVQDDDEQRGAEDGNAAETERQRLANQQMTVEANNVLSRRLAAARRQKEREKGNGGSPEGGF
jgi:hypothetical protein